MNKHLLLDKMRASALGHGIYRLKCLGRSLTAPLQQLRDKRYIASLPHKVEALSRKDTLRVLFFAQHPAYWRCDSLYRLMLAHPRFEPIIVVCGEVQLGYEQMQRDATAMENYLHQKGYAYLNAYDSASDTWLDLRKEIDPDIIFYVKPYQGVVPKRYYYDAFFDKLFIYLPYGMQTTNAPELTNSRGCQLSWLQFYESPMVFEGSPVLKRNSRITGSPKADLFREKSAGTDDPWKIADRQVKRIIWAPHHSIGGGSLSYSNFLQLADGFLTLAEQNAQTMQFAFKPHPLLRSTLYNHPEWGRQRTDAYYQRWDNLPNGMTETGDYVDLFLTSDALIHDCGSFTVEYLLTGNPVMYLAKAHHDDTLNAFGKAAFDLHYQGSTMDDVTHFLHNVLIQGNDPLKEKRETFYLEQLLPPNGKTAAENMIDEILKFKV